MDLTFNSSDSGFGRGDGPDDEVSSSIVLPDGKIVIAGNFTSYNCVPISGITRLLTNGAIDTGFDPGTGAAGNSHPWYESRISAMALQPDGKLLIAGGFTSYNGIARNGIARLNTDGSIDTSFDPGTGADAHIKDMALQPDGKVIVVGYFTSVNGITRNKIARLLPTGEVDTTFTPGTGANNSILSVVVLPNGKLVIGGNFSYYNGWSQGCIARLHSTGLIDPSFNPGLGATTQFTSISPIIRDIVALPDGKLIIGGIFHNYDGGAADHIARVLSSGSIDNSFLAYSTNGPGIYGGSVHCLSVQPDGKILIGGDFKSNSWGWGLDGWGIRRVLPNGSQDASFIYNEAAVGTVRTVSVQPAGEIILGGSLYGYNSTPMQNILRVSNLGALDLTFNPQSGVGYTVSLSPSVNQVRVQPDGRILIAGQFNNIGGRLQNKISRLHTTGLVDTSFITGSGFYDSSLYPYNSMPLNATGGDLKNLLLQPDGKVVVGGVFSRYNGYGLYSLGRLMPNATLDPNASLGSAAYLYISSMALQSDGKIVAVGEFYNPANRIMRRAAATMANDATFNPGTGANKVIRSVAVQTDDKIIIGGEFTLYNGVSRPRLARLLSNGELDTGFTVGSGADSTVTAITIQPDGKILIGGLFSSYNGVPRNRIARLNADGSLDASFDPGSGANGEVMKLLVQTDGKILLCGAFTSFNNSTSGGIARLHANGSLDAGFNAGGSGAGNLLLPPVIYDIALQADGNIIAVGNFTSYNGVGKNRIARIIGDTPAGYTITTGAITNPVLCRGASVDIPYTAAGPFYPGNHFYAVLSDSTGSFANGTTIGFSAGATSGVIAATIPANMPSGQGYRIRVVSSLPAVTGTDNGADLILHIVPLAVAATPATICVGASTVLSATGTGTHSWAASNGLSAQAGSSVVATPASAGTYTYQVIALSNTCTNTSAIIVQVNPVPVVVATSSAQTICAGQSVSFSATGAYGYSWSTGQSQVQIVASPVATTNYIVYGVMGGCSSSDTVLVNVNPLPVVNAIASSDTLCAGQSTSLSASGAALYSWSTSQTGATITVNPAITSTYTVTGFNGNCSATDTVTVNVNPLPAITATASPAVICEGAATTLTASGSISYSWSNNGGSLNTQTVSPTSTTTYTVTGTSVHGCSDSAQVTVLVNPVPQITSVTASPDTVTLGQSVTLSFTESNPISGSIYQWAGPGINQATGAVITANPTSLGLATYTLTITNNNCPASQTVTVFVDQNVGSPNGISSSSLLVFPNPFRNSFNISFTSTSAKAEVVLTDVLGRQIFSKVYQTKTGEAYLQIQPDRPLSQGLYLLQIKQNNQTQTTRIIKQ